MAYICIEKHSEKNELQDKLSSKKFTWLIISSGVPFHPEVVG